MARTSKFLPVKEDWFEIGDQDEYGVMRIKERHAKGGSIWLVEGRDQFLLIDTGIGIGDIRAFLELRTDKPIIAFASVGYYDHAGGLHLFDQRLIHEEDAYRVQTPNRQNTVLDFYFENALSAVPSAEIDPSKHKMQACEPTRLLRDGDVIDLGERHFEVLHLPGVTNGCCGLFERKTGALFTGEAFVWDGTEVYDGEPSERSSDADRVAFCQSIMRLQKLHASTVYRGHGGRESRQNMNHAIANYLAKVPVNILT